MLHFLRIKEYRRCTALRLCHTIYDAPPWPEIRRHRALKCPRSAVQGLSAQLLGDWQLIGHSEACEGLSTARWFVGDAWGTSQVARPICFWFN